jgi:ABC-2 type transport system ATP-binding protein
MGRHIFLYKNADRARLEAIGELHTPSVADLFVATMSSDEGQGGAA